MSFKTKIIGKINFPDFDFTDELEEIAEKVVIPQIVANMRNRKSINDKGYKPLAASTVKSKGQDQPLINSGELHRSFVYAVSGKNRVVVFVGPERDEVADILQNKGVRTKTGKRYFKFFGITKKAEAQGVKRMEKEIDRLIRKFR